MPFAARYLCSSHTVSTGSSVPGARKKCMAHSTARHDAMINGLPTVGQRRDADDVALWRQQSSPRFHVCAPCPLYALHCPFSAVRCPLSTLSVCSTSNVSFVKGNQITSADTFRCSAYLADTASINLAEQSRSVRAFVGKGFCSGTLHIKSS